MTFSESMWRAALAAGLVVGAALPAAAADDLGPAIEAVNGTPMPAAPRFEVGVGARTSLFRGAGYDPFAATDGFSQTSLWASWAAVERGRFATTVGPIFEWGSTSAFARGADASLSLWRLGAVVEERFAPVRRARVFARLAPAWLSGSAKLVDPSLPVALETSMSTFSLDASAGAAGRLNAPTSSLGFWLTGESGYGWAGSQRMAFSPALGAADRNKAGTTALGDLSPRGLFFRFGVALTY
jgi:hypothetical protein